MTELYEHYVENLNHDDRRVRLDSLRVLSEAVARGVIERPVAGDDVNNHIHTSYSFSPYSPTKALWMAYTSGLRTAGIMDHDTVSGTREFIEAGKIIGMATTIGMECRVDFSNTLLNGRRINNPDQKSIAYIALHGIPHTEIDRVSDYFRPYSEARNLRNRLMVERINGLTRPYGVTIDFDTDVVPLSMSRDGGSITERHLLYALAGRMIEVYGKGAPIVELLTGKMGLALTEKVKGYLMDQSSPFYRYDLLGALKSDLVPAFYIDATTECPDVTEALGLCREIGAISAYAYLGDVGDSVTGDKKTQKFEDDYLDLLFEVLGDLGFDAITYMPSRNTLEQLRRVKALCEKYGFFQISGEDINSPRQSFICQAMRSDEYRNLVESTWALIGHEREATKCLDRGMFSEATIRKYPRLDDRIALFAEIGRRQPVASS